MNKTFVGFHGIWIDYTSIDSIVVTEFSPQRYNVMALHSSGKEIAIGPACDTKEQAETVLQEFMNTIQRAMQYD